MKNHEIYRYDWGWAAFERTQMAEDFEDEYGHEPSEDELDKFIQDVSDLNWNDMIENIKYTEEQDGEKYYVILARIGTWHGVYDSGKIVKGLINTILACCEGMDYISIYYKNNQMRITEHHHDGTNNFFIRELTDKGVEYMERHEYDFSDSELYNKLFKSSKLSHMVSLFPNMYGWK